MLITAIVVLYLKTSHIALAFQLSRELEMISLYF